MALSYEEAQELINMPEHVWLTDALNYNPVDEANNWESENLDINKGVFNANTNAE